MNSPRSHTIANTSRFIIPIHAQRFSDAVIDVTGSRHPRGEAAPLIPFDEDFLTTLLVCWTNRLERFVLGESLVHAVLPCLFEGLMGPPFVGNDEVSGVRQRRGEVETANDASERRAEDDGFHEEIPGDRMHAFCAAADAMLDFACQKAALCVPVSVRAEWA